MNKDSFIIGLGYVGKATAKALDIPYHFTRTDSNITLEEGAKKKFCFICLPTPTNEKGGQEEARKVISDYIKQITQYNKRIIFVIRSTVLPGTARALAIENEAMVASCPEFLSEDTWEQDAIKPRILVIGADSIPVKIALENAWKDSPAKIRISTTTTTAETFKYAFNSFMTTKVVWANALYDICQANGADYEVIRGGLMKHPWGSKHHFKVLHKGGRGAGGHCFPKDIKAFAKYGNSKFLKMVEEINKEYLDSSQKE